MIAFEPTAANRATVTALAACGTRQDVIGRYLGIDRRTLRKHFRKELKESMADANAMIAKTLFGEALKGNITACIFWLKTRAHWREVNINELTGPNGQPLTGNVVVVNNGQPIDSAESAMAAYQLMLRNPALEMSAINFAPPALPPLEPPPVTTDEPEPGVPDEEQPPAGNNVITVTPWPK